MMNLSPHTRIWVHSDLQLAEPSEAEETLSTAVNDLLDLNLKLDAIWCLGDAHCGVYEADLHTVAKINVAQLRRLCTPVYYVLGNHEMDLTHSGISHLPLYELASKQPDWHLAALDHFYSCVSFGNFLIVFLGDHVSLEKGWWTSHGYANGADYPYSAAHYERLRQKIRAHKGPVITASHYALPGGQRPSLLLGHLFPLPKNVRTHLYGHAHIGDMVWNKERPWLRENPIAGEKQKQFNISALESKRSPGSHSALLELNADGTIRLRMRCHLDKRWLNDWII